MSPHITLLHPSEVHCMRYSSYRPLMCGQLRRCSRRRWYGRPAGAMGQDWRDAAAGRSRSVEIRVGRPVSTGHTSSTRAALLITNGSGARLKLHRMMNVVGINLTNSTFVFDEAKCAGVHYWPPQLGAPYYALDLLQELDSAGEWWLDRTTGACWCNRQNISSVFVYIF